MRGGQVLLLVIALITSQAFFSPVRSCSIFSLNRDGRIWFASNEDWPLTGFDVWTQPAAEGKHGVFYIGFGGLVPNCGINDQGLCFDLDSVGPKYSQLDSSKITSDRFVLFKVMEGCSSVSEALDTLARYNIEFLSQSQILIADRFGSSVVLESDSVIVRRGEGPQIITNFRHTEAAGVPAPCDRYPAIERVLADGGSTLATMCSALAASCQETGSATQYSVAFDLQSLQLNIWFFHNFADRVTLDLRQELAKEAYLKPLTEMFPYQSAAYQRFVEKNKRPVYETISLEPGYMDGLTGTYAIAPGYNVEISRDGNALYCRMFGMAPFEIFPATPNDFMIEILPAQIEFAGTETGRAASLSLVYPFGKLPAQRVN
jgi:hypothetical protein